MNQKEFFDQESKPSPAILERRQADQQATLYRRRRRTAVRLAAKSAIAVAILTFGLVERNRGEPSGSGKDQGGLVHARTNGKVPTSLGMKPNFAGLYCQTEKITIGPNQTVFSLSTKGLKPDQTFMDAVYSFNLDYVRQQAKRNKALANLNNLQLGTKLKIYGDCIDYTSLEAGYSDNPKIRPRFNSTGQQIPNQYDRALTYQDYLGTDDKKHNDVYVDYLTTPDGVPTKVSYCMPSPACYSYVAGAPTKPPAGY